MLNYTYVVLAYEMNTACFSCTRAKAKGYRKIDNPLFRIHLMV